MPKAYCAVLVGYSSQRNALACVQVAPEQSLMALMAVHFAACPLHDLLELGLQPLVCLKVVWRVGENNLAVTIDGNAVVRVGQIFRCEPEVEGMLRHQLETE